MSENLYLKTPYHNGIGNALCNIILILNEDLKHNLFKKLFLIFDREDSPIKYCKRINNQKLEFIEMKDLDKNINITKLKSIKGYRHTLNFPENNIEKPGILKSVKNYFDLKPNDILKSKLDNYKLGEYISLHIRTTDFETKILKRKENSTNLNDYYKLADENHNLKIWLATDCEYIQNKFIEKYGDRVFFYKKITHEIMMEHGSRFTTAESIYIDFFMCANAKYFLGTRKSTFTNFIKVLRYNNTLQS